MGAEVRSTSRRRRSWFDTFDGDLWVAGLVLEADRDDRSQEVVLRSRHHHAVRWVQRVDEVPRTADELPAEPWRRSLGDVLGLRALIPVAECAVSVTEASLIDARGERVVDLRIEEIGDGEPEGWLRIVPVRGCEREAAEVAARLSAEAGLTPTEGHPLGVLAPDVLARRGATDLVLARDMPAHCAVAVMLDRFDAAMTELEPWLHDPPDTEFLHDYRVALRRSRSVLKLARGILDPADLEHWRPRLRDLQQRTGPLRDIDVFVLEFDEYRSLVPADFDDDLDPVVDLLVRRQLEEQRRLRRYLQTAAHRAMRTSYRTFLDRLTEADAPETPDGASPIGVVGVDRIRAAHRRVLRRGRRVTADSPARDLHEVRIAGKELRYAIELHASLLEPDARGRLIKACKSLQDLLGAFQDAEVHAEATHGLADHLVATGDVPARSIMALGLLAQVFADQHDEIRARFDEEFAAFDRSETTDVLEHAIAGGARP